MDKQDLINKAVEDWRGIYKPKYDYVTMFARGDAYNSSSSRYSDPIFNIHEFNELARELGWINGFKWGVEYPTNGKKPDLPDDVFVEFFGVGGKWRKADRVMAWAWDLSEKFRIVDERYKPKEPESQIKPDNSWYERGELPPVGVECEAYICSRDVWAKVKIVGHDNGRTIWRNGSDGSSYIGSSLHDLRPIQTERDKFIERVCTALHYTHSDEHADLASALYDAGFRAPQKGEIN